MKFWQIQHTRSFKTTSSIAILAAGGWFFWPNLHRAKSDEIQHLINHKSQGLFSAYSPGYMKAHHLKIESFLFDASSAPLQAVDSRALVGVKDRFSSLQYYPGGELLEIDYTNAIVENENDNLKFERVGQVRRLHDDWKEFNQKLACAGVISKLSSGVATQDLHCSAEGQSPWQKFKKLAFETCKVQPLSPHSRRTSVQYGEYKLHGGHTYNLVTRENTVIDGDVICGNERIGLGRQIETVIYTHEEANTDYPVVGARKTLLMQSSVQTRAGRIMYANHEELLATDQPEIVKPRPTTRHMRKRLAQK